MKKSLLYLFVSVLLIVLMIFTVSGVSLEKNEIVIAESNEDFTVLLNQLVEKNIADSYYFSTVIDETDDSNLINGTAEEIVDGEAGVDLFSAIDSQIVGESNITEKYSGEFFTADEIEKFGFVLDVEGEKIEINNQFITKRIVLEADNIEDTFGASYVIGDGEGLFVFQYDSSFEAKEGYDKLAEIYGKEKVGVDSFIKVNAEDNAEENDELKAAYNRVESGRYIEYLTSQGINREITVAVIDSGVDFSHPLLEGRNSGKNDNLIDDGKGNSDVTGHGTHVAGIIAANTPDNVKIMSLKCIYSDGTTTELLVKQAIKKAVNSGAEVINMSLGGECYEEYCVLKKEISSATAAGVVCVVAAGNEGADVSEICPARYSDCITVGSVTDKDTHSYFSNFGDAIDVVAPGENIYSTFPVNMGSFESCTGTSMATPFISAAAAMIKLSNEDATVSQLEEKLKKDAVVDLGLKGDDPIYGAGVLDFGVLLGDKIEVESFSASKSEIVYYENVTEIIPATDFVFEPFDATDKSVSMKPVEGIGFDGYELAIQKTLAQGTKTVLEFSAHNSKSCEVTVESKQNELWVSRGFYVNSNVTPTSDCKGDGSANSPYIIKKKYQFLSMGRYLTNKEGGVYFKLECDIDLKGYYWLPLSLASATGDIIPIYFDGGGHSISNLSIKDYKTKEYVGLFEIFSGEFKNVNFVNVNIDCPSADYAGAVCGFSSGYIKNCYVSGIINGKTAGGLVGKQGMHSDTAYGIGVANCRSDASVTGSIAGGFVGKSENGRINNCVSLAETEGKVSGGIVGLMCSVNAAYSPDLYADYSRIVNCISLTDIAGEKRFGYTYKNKFIPVIENSFYVSDKAVGKDCDSSTTKAEKITAADISQKSFYEDSDKWSSNLPWDMKQLWSIVDGCPKLSQEYEKKTGWFYNYIDLGDAIKLTGYTGKERTLELPDYINGKPVKYIKQQMLKGYKLASKIIIPDTVEYITSAAFSEQEELCSVILGKNVKSIDSYAFAGCYLIQDMLMPESIKEIADFAFLYTDIGEIAFEGDFPESMGMEAFSYTLEEKTVKLLYIEGKKGWDGITPNQTKKISCNPDEVSAFIGERYLILKIGEKFDFHLSTFPKKLKLTAANKTSNYVNWLTDTSIRGEKEGFCTLKFKAEGVANTVLVDVLVYGEASRVVYFDGNGATSGEMPPLVYSSGVANIPENTFKRDGYQFAGWSLKPDGVVNYENFISSAVDKSSPGSEYTLYAIWMKNLSATKKIEATSTTNSVTLKWDKVEGAYGYRIYQKENGKFKESGFVFSDKTEFTINKLNAGQKYTFAVKAAGDVPGKSLYYADEQTTISTATQTVKPSDVKASVTSKGIKVTWNKCDGATGYRVYRKTSNGLSTLTTTTSREYVLKNPAAATKYVIAVRAYIDTSSGRVWSEYTTVEAMTNPAAVKTVKSSVTDSKITLTWSGVKGATGYRVYLYNSKTKKYDTAVSNVSSTKCVISGLKSATSYKFKIRAYIKSGKTVLWGDYSSEFSAVTMLSATSKISVSATEKTITVKWSKVSGATGYKLYTYNSKSKKYKLIATVKNATSYKITSLKAGTTVKIKVVAYKTSGKTTVTGVEKLYTAATLPAAVSVKVTSTSKNKVTVKWSSVSGADGYMLYYKTGNGKYKLYKTYSKAGKVNLTKFKSGTKITFAVKAYKNTSGGKITGNYKEVTVKVK